MRVGKCRGMALLLLTAFLFCGCGARQPQGGTEGGTETEPQSGIESTDTVSMYDLRVAMESAADGLPDMLNASSVQEDSAKSNFAHISDLDYEKVDAFFVSYAAEGGLADEIAVIVVKDKDDVKDAEKSLKDHKQKRYKLLEQYEPAEVKRVEDGVVFSVDRYAVLIICDNSSAVRKAFEEMVSENR